MPKSMTGFGRSALQAQDWHLTWELRSVNSRHLDLKWRLPLFLRSMEAAWERLVREHAQRGRLELNLHVKVLKPELLGISLNTALARAMLEQLGGLAKEVGAPLQPDLNRLLGLSLLWEDDLREPDPLLVEQAATGLRRALEDWNEARGREGALLAEDMRARLRTMHELLAALQERLPAVREEKFAALKTRLETILERFAVDLDQERLLQEVAVLSDRLDVSEELTRLAAHLGRLDDILNNGGETGKRLDFTLQECFREINTLGNKAQDLEASRLVVDFKAELEKCREQVQNLE